MSGRRLGRVAAGAALAGCAALPGFGQSLAPLSFAFTPAEVATHPTRNAYGVTGLVEMPSGEMQRDGDFSFSVAGFGPITRTAITYQITPWMQGTFRYIGTAGLTLGGYGPNDVYYDRSFDVRFRLLREGRWRPSVVIGLQDFVGTGTYSSEYIVATKHIVPQIKVTAGIGWGRLGTLDPILSTGTRPGAAVGSGGTPNFGQWFRGPAALFGGVEWQPTDRLGIKVEYSSDAYVLETRQGLFRRTSALNFAVEYAPTPGIRLGAAYLYGNRVGLSASIALNSFDRAGGSNLFGPAAAPVLARPARAAAPQAWGESWAAAPDAAARLRGPLREALAAEGLALSALAVGAQRAQVRIVNTRYDAPAQAVGRAARVLARTLPASVEVFEIVLVEGVLPVSKVTLRRTDLETLEFAPDAAGSLRARAEIGEAGRLPAGAVPGEPLPRFGWSLSPYLRTSLFDPDNPYRFDVGLRLRGRLTLADGLFLQGSVRQKVFGNLNESRRPSNSVLPRVRTDTNIYDRADTVIEDLYLAWYARPGDTLYSRVTVGWLERQYAGVSGELLWKPVDSRLAFGAELNYVQQRAFDGGLGLRPYTVATGHVSAYYAFTQGFHAQLDVGRYLAGDWGATLKLEREFANGWRVGAFATLTNVPFADFGEGSFDKGITFTIPFTALVGTPSRVADTQVIRPIMRDGGARLSVPGRLYETVRGAQGPALDATWGRVWR